MTRRRMAEEQPKQETTLPLHLKYRPSTFKEVLGQDTIIKSLKAAMTTAAKPHAFLFSGPPGTGKTTLARIVATACNVPPGGIVEIDAASNSGIDAMRDVLAPLQYQGFGTSPNKMVIVDECFAKGTPVSTVRGRMPIEEVLVGDIVIGALGMNRVSRVFQNRVLKTRVVRLRLQSGSDILCSEDHAFLTMRGWVKAKELMHVGYIIPEGTPVPMYVQDVWDKVYEQLQRGEVLQFAGVSWPRQAVHLREDISGQASVMLDGVRQQGSCVEEDRASSCMGRASCEGRTTGLPQEQSSASGGNCNGIFQTDADKQPSISTRGTTEDARDQGEEGHAAYMASAERWQRAAHEASVATGSSVPGSCSGMCNLHGGSAEGVAYLLQSGSGLSCDQTRCGGRWTQPCDEGSCGEGCPEDTTPDGHRLVGVSSVEYEYRHESTEDGRTDPNGDYETFFDLEVEGHPSYSVLGLVVHNCHGLSKQAFDSLLKTLEEPPEHVFFALCTTLANKVPAAIMTRCQSYVLKPCGVKTLEDLLFDVCDAEGYKTPDVVIQAAVDAAKGSPRQALVNLAKVHDVVDIEDAERLLEAVAEDKDIIDICRQLLARQLTWGTLRSTIKAMPSPDAEAIRIVISCYLAGCVMGARDERDIRDLCAIAYKFSKPFNPTDKLMPLFIAFDDLIGN